MSEIEVDKITQKGTSGISITDDIKLSSGKSIKNAAGTALLSESGAFGDIKLSSGKAIKQADGTDLLTEAGVLGHVLLPFIKNQGDVANTLSESDVELQFGGTILDNGMVYLARQLVAASTTLTVATPTAFNASSCVLCGKNRASNNAANIETQAPLASHNADFVAFTAANTLSLYNSSGYTVYFYYALLRFK
jgi:hypothetical protein